jgi:isopentenyl-diphosphate delta-isomerase
LASRSSAKDLVLFVLVAASDARDQELKTMDDIPTRKADHIDVVTQQAVTASISAGWDDVTLVHQSLPEIDLAAVDLGIDFLGHRLDAPLVIASMTGGHPRATEINRVLARAAQHFNVAMGVGSQRAALRRPELLSSYTVAREAAPHAFLIANVGAPQLIAQGNEPPLTDGEIDGLVSSLGADALAIHLNYLQEVAQPEGDTHAKGVLRAIQRVAERISVPVIAKETGAGISRAQATLLADAGVGAIDVGGAGGTSFALVEAFRSGERGLAGVERLGRLLGDWGIPTTASVVECAGLGLPVIATGGIRSGLDAAKALALGADAVAIARPMLAAALEGFDPLCAYIEELLDTMRAVFFLTGSASVEKLHACDRVITGRTAEWIRARHLG